MTAFDRERTTGGPPPAGASLVVGFVVVWTALAGLFFAFGIVFCLVVVGLAVRAQLNGQLGNNLAFFAIVVPFMAVYLGLAGWFFRTGLAFLRGNARRNDPFDADGQPKRPTETD